MPEVKPLFDEPDSTAFSSQTVKPLSFDDPPAKPKTSNVSALDLANDFPSTKRVTSVVSLDLPEEAPRPKKEDAVVRASSAFASEEHPFVSQAMQRGEAKFPLIMKESGFLVRDNLNSILPVSFETLSQYGSDVLVKAASLIDDITNSIEKVHEVNAEGNIKHILESADTTKHKPSLLGFISGSNHFDPNTARMQLSAIKSLLSLKLAELANLTETLDRTKHSLSIKTTVMAIVGDMSDHGDIGNLVARKANLFSVSLQEIDISNTQVQNIKKQTQEWILRCEEISTITLPALGFKNQTR
jgi:hypothetical protein